MPRYCGGNRRNMSPARLSSLATSAPRSPRIRPPIGPATTVVKSRTLRPPHGPSAMAVTSRRFLLDHGDDAGALGARAVEQFGVGAGALDIKAVGHLPGAADGAEDLDAPLGHGPVGVARVGLGQ